MYHMKRLAVLLLASVFFPIIGIFSAKAASPYAGSYVGYVYFSISGTVTQPEQPVGAALFNVDDNGNITGSLTGTVNGSGTITWDSNSSGFTTGTISGGVLASTVSQNNGGAISTSRIAANNTGGGFGTGGGVAKSLTWHRPSPNGSAMRAVTYGGGKYVAVGPAGSVAYSSNGTNWIAVNATTTTQQLNGVAYGNNMYVAVGDGLTVISSPDAITWTARSVNGTANQNMKGIAYGAGTFVAVNIVNEIFTSADGITWTKIGTPPTNGSWNNLKYVGSMFVLVGGSGGSTFISTSANGTTWNTIRSVSSTGGGDADVTYANSKWVGVGGNNSFSFTASDASDAAIGSASSSVGDAVAFVNNVFVSDKCFFSTNGVNWFRNSYPTVDINDMAVNNGLLVSVGEAMMTTPDGKTWSVQTRQAGLSTVNNQGSSYVPTGVYLDDFTFVHPSGAARYTRIGLNGLIEERTNSNSSYYSVASPTTNTLREGITANNASPTSGIIVGDNGTILRYSGVFGWTNVASGTSSHLKSIAISSSSPLVFVAVGTGGTILRTTNAGQTWGAVSSGTANNLNRVYYNPTSFYFVAVGDNGTILKSTDGSSWSVLTSGTTKKLVGIGHYGSGTVNLAAVAEDSTVFVSENNGTSWRSITVNAPHAITWGDSSTAVGESGFSMSVTGTGNTNWTYSLPSPGNFTSIMRGNGRYFLTTGNYRLASPDLESWTSLTSGSFTTYGFAAGNGIVVSVGSGHAGEKKGYVSTTVDGTRWYDQVTPTATILYSVVYGAGKFVAVGESETILTSPDGVNWTSWRTNSGTLNSVTYGNNMFVAVGVSGSSGTIRYSSDGQTWNATSAGNTGFNSVTYANGLFILVGDNGRIYSSSNGSTWTLRTPTPSTSRAFRTVEYVNDRFIAVGDLDGSTGTGAVVAHSTDGTTWTKEVSNISVALYSSVAAKGKYVAVGNNGSIVTAPYTESGAFALTGQPGPASQTVNGGATVTYTATVNGSGVQYRWVKDGVPLTDGPGISGATTASLTLSGVDVLDTGIYYLSAWNDYDSGVSQALTLNVNGAPIITVHPVSVTTSNTLTTNFTVKAVGPGMLSYQWRKGGVPLTDGGHYSGTSTPTLTISSASGADEATYDVIVTNTYGSSSPSHGAMLTVKRPATITQAPVALLKLKQGETIQLSAMADGSPTIAYTWKKDGVVLTDNGRISGATTPNLTITGATVADRGSYTLSVTNSFLPGATSTAAYVSVLGPGALHHDFVRTVTGSYAYAIVLAENGEYIIGGDIHTTSSSDIFRMKRDGSLNTNFTATGTGTSGGVAAIGELNNGKLLIGGFTTWINVSGFVYNLRLNTTGSVDTNFTSTINTAVIRIVRLPDGKLLVAATSTGFLTRQLYRFNPDGTLDGTFTSTSMPGVLNDMAVQSDGKIILADAGGIKRLNADGTGLTGYLVSGGVTAVQVGPDDKVYFSQSNVFKRVNADFSADNTFSIPVAGTVYSTAFLPDGRFVIVGNFQSVNSAPNTALIALLEANGTLNSGFLSPYTWSAANVLYNILRAEDGSVLVGGTVAFNLPTTQYLVQRIYVSEENIYFNTRPASQTVNRNGSVTFTAEGGGTTAITGYQWRKNGQPIFGATGSSYTIAGVQETDAGSYDVIITNSSGSLTSNAATLTVLGDVAITAQPQSLVKTNTQTATFSVSVTGDSALPVTYQWRKDGVNITGATNATYSVIALVDKVAQYDVVVSTPVNSVTSSSAGLTVVYPTAAGGTIGTLNTSFTPASMTGQSGPPVRGIDVDSQGRVYITGSFTGYNGQTRNKVMRLNQDLSLDASFAPSFSTPSAFTSPSITRFLPDGSYLIGGMFTAVNSTATYGLARFNSADQLQSGPALSSFTYLGEQNTYGAGITVNQDGSYFLSGNFTTVGGTARTYFAKVKADHTLDTGFVPSSYPDATMRATAVDSSGRVIVTGTSSTVGGVSHFGLLRYSSSGTLDTTFNTQVNAASSGPANIGFQSTGKIIIIGFFTSVKDNPSASAQTRNGIARLNTDGTVDTTFDPNLSAGAQVHDMIIQSDDKIIIVGNFTTVNGVNRQRIARLNADGTLDTTFGSSSASGGAPDVIYTIAQLATGDYLIGGSFTSFAGDNSKQYLARIHGQPPAPPALDIVQDPASKTVYAGETVTLSAAAVGAAPLTFQWYKGSTPLGITTPQLVLSEVDAGDAGAYHVVVTDGTSSSVTSADATLTVNEPLTFAEWMSSQGLTAGGNIGPEDDADGDGVKNIVEYVFGTHPNQSSSKPVIEKVTVNSGGIDYQAIRAVVLKNVEDVEVLVTASTTPTFDSTIGVVITEEDLGSTKRITIRSGLPIGSVPTLFFRIVIQGVVIDP